MRLHIPILFVAFVISLTLALPAQAQGPGNGASGGEGPGWVSEHPFGSSGWFVEGAGGEGIGIYYDPNAGPWHKNLGVPPGGFTVGGVYWILEKPKVAAFPASNPPGPPWTDWHETILSLGFQWFADANHPWSFASDQAGLGATWTFGAGLADFYFTPTANVGTTLTITKYVRYVGGGFPNQPLTIGEFPTIPEPSTIVLLGVSAIGLLTYAWRRRAAK
jgi:hypothetical protein